MKERKLYKERSISTVLVALDGTPIHNFGKERIVELE